MTVAVSLEDIGDMVTAGAFGEPSSRGTVSVGAGEDQHFITILALGGDRDDAGHVADEVLRAVDLDAQAPGLVSVPVVASAPGADGRGEEGEGEGEDDGSVDEEGEGSVEGKGEGEGEGGLDASGNGMSGIAAAAAVRSHRPSRSSSPAVDDDESLFFWQTPGEVNP